MPQPELGSHQDTVTTVTTDDPVVRHDLGLGPGGWILTRPDGYVAARGRHLDTAALAAHLPVPGAATY